MIKEVAFLTRGPNRVKVLEVLDSPKTPTQLSKTLKIHRPSISATLIELEKKGFVKCLNPDDRMGRYYQATERGKKVLKTYSEL